MKNAPEFVDEVFFSGPFPERAQFTIELPAELTDDAGRTLANQKRFPLAVRTDEYPPLAKFPARFGIIEAKGDGMMPVTLRNLEAILEARMAKTGKLDEGSANLAEKADAAINWLKNKLDESKQSGGTVPGSYSRVADGDVTTILDWMKRLRQMENERWRYDEKTNQNVREYRLGQASIFSERDRVTRLQVPKPDGARAFEVVGIPLRKPGFYVVELASPRLGAALLNSHTPYYVQSAALVTNLSVHFKWGRESSLVWVTALDSGAPMPNAHWSRSRIAPAGSSSVDRPMRRDVRALPPCCRIASAFPAAFRSTTSRWWSPRDSRTTCLSSCPTGTKALRAGASTCAKVAGTDRTS